MDFLDPRRRKAYRRRLFIGYALMSIVIALGTLLVLYLAYGYNVDRENGEFIQNGIVFVDSKPKGATVYVNDVAERSTTDTRLVLPQGDYTIRLEAPGFRTWQKSIKLQGGQIERMVYPLLLPNSLITSDIQTYDATPQIASQSPDRRWVLVQKPGQTYKFDVFDLNNPESPQTQIAVPVAGLTKPSAEATLEIVEWSNDNRHILIKRSYEGVHEYIMFDRERNGDSVNLNSTLGITPAKVSLKDKRPDQIYFLDAVPGSLRSADTKARTISAPLLNAVIDYTSYSDDIVLFVTREGSETSKADFKVLESDKIVNIRTVTESDKYVMNVSKYQDEWFYVVGAAKDNVVFVYKNPLPALKNNQKSQLNVTVLGIENPRFVTFSANTQFIAVQSGKTIRTLDLEYDRQHKFTLDQDIPLNQEVKWMDGHRFLYAQNQQSHIIDFDGANKQTLVTTSTANGPFFDRDYNNVYTLEGSKTDKSKVAFTLTVINK